MDSDIWFESASCEKHGDYQRRHIKFLTKVIKSGCPECEKERTQEGEEQKARREAVDRRIEVKSRLGGALIPPRFAGKSFDGYNAETPAQKKALEACVDYATNFVTYEREGRCLLLMGKPGTGKTHLAAAIASWLIENTGKTAVYRTVAGILQYIKGSYDQHSEYSEAQAFKSLQSADLLIIDEVGATKPSEFEQATLFQVINDRYEQCRPTCIISNLMPKEIAPILGERSVDRLREGGGIPVVFDWASERSKAFLKGGSK